MKLSVSCGRGVSLVWEVLLCDVTSARTITVMSGISKLSIVINMSMMVLVIIIIIIVIKVIVLSMTRKLQILHCLYRVVPL